ncbi:MAG: hypothetical protein ABS85_01555 [Sphingobacteriales bacterium SCN 48-20]|nr:MAG: hypothetical protein ABS85_01555 [Sphingobacteriales bacterium SCN 48-20]OJW39967.1 MAG: hypothetical protein BGO56_03650 [Sphingobacteriales bacterium 48-107]
MVFRCTEGVFQKHWISQKLSIRRVVQEVSDKQWLVFQESLPLGLDGFSFSFGTVFFVPSLQA